MIIRFFLLLISAGLYAIPFIVSEQCWFLVWLFLIPLFYVCFKYKVSWKEGLFWGFTSAAFHLGGVFYSIMYMAQGPLWHKIIPGIGGCLYFGIYAAVWFGITALVSRYVSCLVALRHGWIRQAHHDRPLALSVVEWVCVPYIKKNSWYNMGNALVWLISLWFLFYSYDHFCLFLFNRVEGLFLLSPLLPLAEYMPLLRMLLFVPKPLVLFLFCAVPWSFTCAFYWRNWKLGILALITCVPWLVFLIIPVKKETAPLWLNDIACVQASFFDIDNGNSHNAPLLAQAVKRAIDQTLQARPSVKLIIFPESSLVRCYLNECSDITAFWKNETLNQSLAVLVGAFRRDETGTHNSVYWIKDGIIQGWFDKRHAMLLTEHIAPWWKFDFLHDLYFKHFDVLTFSENKREPWEILPGVKVVPYICSELFFNEYADDEYPGVPLIALCNDTWVYAPFIKRLMFLNARMKAAQWRRPLLYTSFSYVGYLTPDGAIY